MDIEKANLEDLITAAAKAAVAEANNTQALKCSGCACEENIKAHAKEHEFIRQLMDLFDRIDGIKWGVAKGVAKALAIAGIFGLLAFFFGDKVRGG